MKIKENLAKFSLALCIVASVFIVSSCNDDEESEAVVSTPTISSVSPSEAVPEAEITLTGTNFSATATENSVSIGGTSAIVSAASTTSITCEVPTLDAGQADITVTVDGESSTAYAGFTVLEAVTAPTVSSFSPDGGSVGDEVVISGSDFGTDASVLTVTINDVVQEIDEETVSDTEITITLASKTFSGNVVVSKSGLKDSADAAYTYKESYRVDDFRQEGIYAFTISPKNGHIFYRATTAAIVELDADGTLVDTLIGAVDSKLYLLDKLHCDSDGNLYLLQADSKAGIKYIAYGTTTLETLIDEGNSFLESEKIYDFTGDIDGNLYITDYVNEGFGVYYTQIKQINIANKSITVILNINSFDQPQFITYYNNYLYYSQINTSYGTENIQKWAIGSTTPELVYNAWVYYDMVYHSVVGLLAFTWDGVTDSDKTLVKVTGTDTEEHVLDFSELSMVSVNDFELTVDGDILVGNDYALKKIVIE